MFAGLAVSDFAAACDWYGRLFGSPPAVLPRDGEAVWHPVASASVYITRDPGRAGHGLLTVAVKDLDGQRVDLARRGIVFGENAELNGMRTLLVTDPEGNMIKFFEDPAHP